LFTRPLRTISFGVLPLSLRIWLAKLAAGIEPFLRLLLRSAARLLADCFWEAALKTSKS
jgi:hypothetical protein